jgi:hypothetical protein
MPLIETYSALRLSWPGKKERDPIFPCKARRFVKISYKVQTSANGKIASLCFLPANSNAKHFKITGMRKRMYVHITVCMRIEH